LAGLQIVEPTGSSNNDGSDRVLEQDYENGAYDGENQPLKRVQKEEGDNEDQPEEYDEDQDDSEAHRPLQSAQSRHESFLILENLIRPFFNSILERGDNASCPRSSQTSNAPTAERPSSSPLGSL